MNTEVVLNLTLRIKNHTIDFYLKYVVVFMSLYSSIVKVYTTSLNPIYSEPWRSARTSAATGSGFMVRYKDKLFLLTNAHVVNQSSFVQVKLADADYPTKYEAKVITIGRDCDLAIMEVNDPKFLATIQPLEFATTRQKTGDKAKTLGFPVGGEECCQTEGVISRSDWTTYAYSQYNLLSTSIDAKISPGNSGGPVLNVDDRVVGVVHQGNPEGRTLGQMIPLDIVFHFLDDAIKNTRYAGFPDFEPTTQDMENPSLRNYFGMAKNQTGVLVIKVPEFSSAYGFLQADDVLLTVDGLPINNMGKVSLKSDFETPVDFRCIVQRHHVREAVSFTVLREKREIKVDIPLNHSLLETNNLIPFKLDEDTPAFIEHSGLILMPLTKNYVMSFVDPATGACKAPQTLSPYINASSLTKTEACKQKVLLRAILLDNETQGYSALTNASIQEINGRKITNLWAAWHALESNQEDLHVIRTNGDNLLVVPNLKPAENQALRQRYQVTRQTAPRYSDGKRWSMFMSHVQEDQKKKRFEAAILERDKLRSNPDEQELGDEMKEPTSNL